MLSCTFLQEVLQIRNRNRSPKLYKPHPRIHPSLIQIYEQITRQTTISSGIPFIEKILSGREISRWYRPFYAFQVIDSVSFLKASSSLKFANRFPTMVGATLKGAAQLLEKIT